MPGFGYIGYVPQNCWSVLSAHYVLLVVAIAVTARVVGDVLLYLYCFYIYWNIYQDGRVP